MPPRSPSWDATSKFGHGAPRPWSTWCETRALASPRSLPGMGASWLLRPPGGLLPASGQRQEGLGARARRPVRLDRARLRLRALVSPAYHGQRAAGRGLDAMARVEPSPAEEGKRAPFVQGLFSLLRGRRTCS